jgi:mRNA interferase RelE/StbE
MQHPQLFSLALSNSSTSDSNWLAQRARKLLPEHSGRRWPVGRVYIERREAYLSDMDLAIDKAAAKILTRMQPKLAASILKKMEALAGDPMARHANVETMQGLKDAFRLRQGDWRIIFEIDSEEGVVRVTKIGPRGQVYR